MNVSKAGVTAKLNVVSPNAQHILHISTPPLHTIEKDLLSRGQIATNWIVSTFPNTVIEAIFSC
jgi:hypothetical protein